MKRMKMWFTSTLLRAIRTYDGGELGGEVAAGERVDPDVGLSQLGAHVVTHGVQGTLRHAVERELRVLNGKKTIDLVQCKCRFI